MAYAWPVLLDRFDAPEQRLTPRSLRRVGDSTGFRRLVLSMRRGWFLSVDPRRMSSGQRVLPKAARCPVPSQRAALDALARVHAAVQGEVAQRSLVPANPAGCGT